MSFHWDDQKYYKIYPSTNKGRRIQKLYFDYPKLMYLFCSWLCGLDDAILFPVYQILTVSKVYGKKKMQTKLHLVQFPKTNKDDWRFYKWSSLTAKFQHNIIELRWYDRSSIIDLTWSTSCPRVNDHKNQAGGHIIYVS